MFSSALGITTWSHCLRKSGSLLSLRSSTFRGTAWPFCPQNSVSLLINELSFRFNLYRLSKYSNSEKPSLLLASTLHRGTQFWSFLLAFVFERSSAVAGLTCPDAVFSSCSCSVQTADERWPSSATCTLWWKVPGISGDDLIYDSSFTSWGCASCL